MPTLSKDTPWLSALPTPYRKPIWAVTPEQERAALEQWMRENEPRLNILMDAYKGPYEQALNAAKGGDQSKAYLLGRADTGQPWWESFIPSKLLDTWGQYLSMAPLYTPGPNPYGVENPNKRPDKPAGYDWWNYSY